MSETSVVDNTELPYPASFSRPLAEEKDLIVADIIRWAQTDRSHELDLPNSESIVIIKNTDRVVTFQNAASKRFLTDGASIVGTSVEQHMDPKFQRLSRQTDGLILDGVTSLEFEHVAMDSNRATCTFVSRKRRLQEINDPNYAILVISRPISILNVGAPNRRKDLRTMLSMLQALDITDQKICNGYGMGESTKHIAASVGLTTRSVELRRQKVMDLFGFSHPIEIVKMLVRLEENGLIFSPGREL